MAITKIRCSITGEWVDTITEMWSGNINIGYDKETKKPKWKHYSHFAVLCKCHKKL